MRLYLIRHAESANNASWRESGGAEHVRVPDPEITQRGHQQSRHLAEHVATAGNEPRQSAFQTNDVPDYGLHRLYCSLMTRSLQTAYYVQQHSGIELQALPDVFERKGLFDLDESGQPVGVEGPGRRYFEERFPEVLLPTELGEQGWWNRPMETDEQFIDRVASSIQSLIERHNHSDDVIGLVAHGEYIDQAINYLLEIPRHIVNYQTPWVVNWVCHNTSLTRIDITGDARNVIYLNRVDHLPDDQISW